jgi:outer membrane protein TolC
LASKGQLLQKLYFHFGDKFDHTSVLTMNINTWHMKIINKDSLLDISKSDLRNLANEQYISNAKQNIERLSKNSGFSANLDISIGLNNSNNQIDQLFINPQDRQLGSVSLSVPIFNGNKNKLGILQAKNELAQINLDKKLMTQTTLERINQLLLQFEQYKSQINLAQRSLILSEKRMHRYFRLFQDGKITVDQYVQIQHTVLNLKLDVLTTRINYWKLWYSYWF